MIFHYVTVTYWVFLSTNEKPLSYKSLDNAKDLSKGPLKQLSKCYYSIKEFFRHEGYIIYFCFVFSCVTFPTHCNVLKYYLSKIIRSSVLSVPPYIWTGLRYCCGVLKFLSFISYFFFSKKKKRGRFSRMKRGCWSPLGWAVDHTSHPNVEHQPRHEFFLRAPVRITHGVSFLATERHKSLGLNALPRRKVRINDLERQPPTASFRRYGGGGSVVAAFSAYAF